jgi:DNA-binding SARP family transcriptional activator
MPGLAEQRVPRPRLARRLAELLERHRVVVVSATPGAGKTTAVAGALLGLGRPAAWLTVDRTDTAPGRLVSYLEAALAQAVPAVEGAATEALSAGIPHAEAAGLLAEAAGDAEFVLVIDELERLADADAAWQVIESLLRYAPAGMRVVLISRRAVPALAGIAPAEAASLGELELAFTTEEAAEALAQRGLGAIDAHAAVDATGGWVTGVLFEAWTVSAELAGAGGDADPLHGYLSAHILDELPAAARDFLVTTSVLDEVTATRAHALGIVDAVGVLGALRSERLPVTWTRRGRALRCHSRFREYLLERLEEREPEAMRALRIAHGHLLAREGLEEEAVEELLAADAPAEALPYAEAAIVPVMERLDVALAERWLARLAGVAPAASPALVAAELLLAIGGEDFRRADLVVDRVTAAGERERLAGASPLVAALMAWSCVIMARPAEATALLDIAPDDPTVAAMRYGLSHVVRGPPAPRPALTGGPLDALVLATDYFYGRLSELVEHEGSRFVDAVAAAPRRIAVLRALGRTQRALEVYEATLARSGPTLQVEGYVGPELLTDAGRRDDALAALARGRALARASGSAFFEASTEVADARFRLRLEHDPHGARAVLDRAERKLGGRSVTFIAENIDTWYGLALLQLGEDGEALVRLRRAVAGMLAGQRVLELPTAAVYLAEAEWRAGDEDAADRAADVALDAARRQGSNHMLLQALADFPAVVSRRIDAEPRASSPWHELGRALIAQGTPVAAQIRAAVELLEFGRSAIVVDGVERRPRIAKTYELLAYLAVSRDARAGRAELLDALFDGRSDDSTRAYLRQAVRWLRSVLPQEDAVIADRGAVQLGDAVAVSSESVRFQALLAEAARRQGEQRLAATVTALELHDRGDYLPDGRSRWVDRRRSELDELAADARADAAELAFAAGRLDDADRLAQAVLRVEPFRESAWRVTMQVAGALGDHDGVLRAYQACERELATLGTTPSPGTRELLDRLRR